MRGCTCQKSYGTLSKIVGSLPCAETASMVGWEYAG